MSISNSIVIPDKMDFQAKIEISANFIASLDYQTVELHCVNDEKAEKLKTYFWSVLV